MSRVADHDRDPDRAGRRHEPAVLVRLDDDDRDAPGMRAECDAVADRAKPGDDDVVADVARDRAPTERLEEPRADDRVGDERIDDRDQRGPDETQDDRVDAQGARRLGRVDVDRDRGAGQQRDGVREGVERAVVVDEREVQRRPDGEEDEDRQ